MSSEQTPPSGQLCYRLDQVSALTGLKSHTLYRLMKRGSLPYVKPSGTVVLIRAADLNRLLQITDMAAELKETKNLLKKLEGDLRDLAGKQRKWSQLPETQEEQT